MATSFTVNKADLEFMLKQIKIAEATSIGYTPSLAPVSIQQAIMDAYGVGAADAAIAPYGLRTVDGSFNSLVPGQSKLGAADTVFPRLTDPVYRNETDGDSLDLNGPAPGGILVQGNYGSSGNVVDADPRIISNLIVDMSVSNPAAIAAYLSNPLSLEQFEADHPGMTPVAPADIATTALLAAWQTAHPGQTPLALTNTDLQTIPNQSPDIGLSPGFNAWMTFFGQFFDHGLDLVTKGGNGTVFVPLQPDDPLITLGPDGIAGTGDEVTNPALQFMALTRATPVGGGQENTTTSFVDQNQTYTSHASHQVFLREYVKVDIDGPGGNGPVAVSTGKMLDGSAASGGIAGAIGNWADVKAQAKEMLGIILTDFDVHNVPLLLTDQYGKFIPSATGYAQVVTAVDANGVPTAWVSGTAEGLTLPVNTVRTGHAFLNDIAHHASPGFIDLNHNGVMDAGEQLQTPDTLDGVGDDHDPNTYDDEMLNSHFVTGDGRGNENIALTAVHSIFHSEHNRLVDVNKATILQSGDLAFLNEWLLTDVASLPVIPPNATPAQLQAVANSLTWDGERLFQAARFATEMQYQHLVFEEFARRIQPMVDPFVFNTSPDVDPSIVAEFAHTVYRFGHSMLTGTVDRLDNNLDPLNPSDPNSVEGQQTLLAVFLNPQAYVGSGATLEEINANIIRGLSRDVGNEIDEFIVTDVRSNLLGLPLDLAVLNISRGRETGIPSLNQTRAQLYNDTGLADLKPYESWFDFAQNIKNAASVVNFIAAYGTHSSIANATTLADKRAAAEELVFGVDGPDADTAVPGDRLDFLNARGAYANDLGGLNLVDLWIGGLAEKINEFGGMLGSTFNYVFEAQMENLQNGDRMYYLSRTQGTNFLNNLEPNTFSDLVMRNTELGDSYSTHLNGSLFVTPDHIIELDRGIAQEDYNGSGPNKDPEWDGSNPVMEAILGPKVVRDYTGAATVLVPTTNLPQPAITNGSFEQNSLAAGQPGVIVDALGNYTLTAPTGWAISGGDGGMFAPASGISDPVGHAGSNVVWLRSGATLSKNTGISLVQGATYTVSLNVGDRTDQSWPGGTARLMASDGTNPPIALETLALTTAPADGQWSAISLSTGAIAAAYSGFTLYIEVQQSDGTGNQILVDDVSIAANYTGASVTHDVGGTLRFLGGEHVVLGGTEGDDKLYSDKGIDTLWGDGGNDYLNAGMESDDVFGGEGDDIIEDPFGDDVLRGNQGNDVITSARGADLLFGDDGTDYVVVGQDASEVFAGTGADFVLGGAGKDFLLGNEGDDWMEGGAGFDTIAGDNSELFFNSPLIGHDVLFGHGDETDYDAESGDDIMGSGPSVFRYEGMFGFDWGIAKNDNSAIRFDLQIPIFTTIAADVLRDRFDQVEALSGWKNSDVLDGDDRGHKGGGSSAPDSIPVQLFADHLLTQEGIDRIDGLNDWFGGARNTLFGPATPIPGTTSLPATTYRDGNILMGGDGSDFLRGRGGYDILDGDAWLNVRIKIVHNGVTYSAESMTSDTTVMGPNAGKVFNVYTVADQAADPTHIAGSPNFGSPAFDGASLTSLMLNRTLNPGELSIVREILYDTTNVTGVGMDNDTAIFQGTLAEYEIEGRVTDGANNGGNVITQAHDVNGDGFISVRDKDTGAVGAIITGPDGQPLQLSSSRGALTDDTDLLKNIEMLRFADKTIVIAGSNQAATGTVTIADLQNKLVNPADVSTTFDLDGDPATPALVTPYVGQVLKASLSNASDANGIPLDSNGKPLGLTYEWQTTETGGNAGWTTITTGESYTVRSVDPGHILRAVAVFKDGAGATETIISAATDGATAPFFVNENSPTNTVVATSIPFNPDYDPDQTPGGPTDGDIVALTHVLKDDAGGRFQLVTVGGVQQLQVRNGGPVNLDYETDNEHQIVIDSYIDAASAAALDPAGRIASRQFTVLLNDVFEVATNATGTPVIVDANGGTPTEGQALTVDTSGIADPNGLGTLSYQWESSPNGANVWTPIAGATAASFTPQDLPLAAFGPQAGLQLRVKVSFTDGAGTQESLTSAPTGPVGVNWNAVPLLANTFNGTAGDDLANGTDGVGGAGASDTLNGNAGNDILNGLGGADTLNGGTGDDTVNGGADNDTIVQTSTDGRDIVDGGANNDTYVLNGVAGAETFAIYSRAAALAAIAGVTLAANTEIVIARNGAVIAELDNIEEIRVNTLGGAGGGTGVGDTIQVIGSFVNTSLNFSTITIDGSTGNDTVDISALTSAHRIVFKSNGGNDTIVGALRPQDVIELPNGKTAADYQISTVGANTTMTSGNHTISFASSGGLPQFTTDHEDDEEEGSNSGNHDDHDDDQDGAPDCGTNDGHGHAGTGSGQTKLALSGGDQVMGGADADVIIGEAGNDFLSGEGDRDVIFAAAGDDKVMGGEGADMLFGEAGADHLFGDLGNDLIDAGTANDMAFAGDGDDVFLAGLNDGDDTYYGDAGSDTLDMSAITANVTVDLGTGFMGRGSASSTLSGSDTLWGVENVITGTGNDKITASDAVNVIDAGLGNDTFRFTSAAAANGDTIMSFEVGDRIDLSAMDANGGVDGNQAFTLVPGGAFTGVGQLIVTHETWNNGEFTVIQGNVSGDVAPEFKINIAGHHTLTAADLAA